MSRFDYESDGEGITDTVCVSCHQPGGAYFGDFFMHDRDADAYACPLGNNWSRLPDGSIKPWDRWPAHLRLRAARRGQELHYHRDGLMPAGVGPDGPLDLGSGFAVERVRGLYAQPCEAAQFLLVLLYQLCVIEPRAQHKVTPDMVAFLIEQCADGKLLKVSE